MSESTLTLFGSLPDEWEVRPLGEVLEKQVRPVHVNPTETYREIGIRSHGRGIFHKESIKGTELGDKRVFWVEGNCLIFNIVFAWEGAVAVTRPTDKGMIVSHRFPMFAVRDKNVVEVDYLRRFFQTPLGVRLLGEASPGGAGRNRTLNQKLLGEVQVPLPPFGEQRKIAAILASVDDALEATQTVIDQLNVVKKAMMAELLTRGLPGRHTGFKQTEIGEVPEEWDVLPLRDLLESIDSGWSPQCETRPASVDEWGVLKVSAVTSGAFRDDEQKALPPNMAPRPSAEVKSGDVLLARANGVLELVGKTVLVRTTRPKLMLSDKLLRLRPIRSRLDAPFLSVAMGTDAVRSRLLSTTGGSHMRNVSQANLRALLVPVPPLREQSQIAGAVDAVEERLAAEHLSRGELRRLKSALMSVLLTGELRVTPDEAAA